MKRNIIFVTFLMVALSGVTKAQQDPLYSQYMFNMLGVNPAYAGNRELLSVTAINRNQWVGLKGAPTSNSITGDFSLKNKKVGLGLQLFNDKIGVMKTTGANIAYAYRLKVNNKGVLALGLQAGLTYFKANYADVQLSSGDAPDNAFKNNINEARPNFGAGVFYSTDRFYAGVSAPHLLKTTKYYSTVTGENMTYQNNHWIFTTGYVFNLSYDVALKPSILLRMVEGAPLLADFNANVWFYNTVSIGVSVRTSNMIVGMLEIQASKQFRFGYAYDYTTTGLTNAGSHEIMLRYEFGFEKKRMLSPRYF